MKMRRYSPNQQTVAFSRGLPTGVKWLLIINVIVYVILLFDRSGSLVRTFGLTPNDVLTGPLVYQVATYMFLHNPSGIFHILFNMFMLWMFGSEVERTWGTKKFLKFYLLTGVVAGIFTVIVTPGSVIPVIGASGAVLAVMVAFAVMWPNRMVLLYFLIPIKVKYLMMFIVALDLILAFASPGDDVARWTHLGGAVFGFLYVKGNIIPAFFRRKAGRIKDTHHEWREEKDKLETDKLMEEVDRILDKINDVGIDNLTDKERKILERASSRLSKKRK